MFALVRNPNIQVLLHKVVIRTGPTTNEFSSQNSNDAGDVFSSLSTQQSQLFSSTNVYDVTKWLGEGSVVRVQKSVRGEGGAFSIDFVDQLNGLTDTLYSLIEPMDMFEIRFASNAYQYAGANGQQLPIMMRGFVSDIERSQSMGSDGKPRRTIHVTGHDYHKILQIIQIYNMPATPDVANLISSFPMFSKYGEAFNVKGSTAFVMSVLTNIVNAYIDNMNKPSAIPPGQTAQQQMAALVAQVNANNAQAQSLLNQANAALAMGNQPLQQSLLQQAQAALVPNQALAAQYNTIKASVGTTLPAESLLAVAADIQVPDALVSAQLGAFNGGTIQQLFEEYLDIGPFNEFFIEDRDAGAWGPAGPYAVYRPAPLLGAVSRVPLQPIQDSMTTGVSTDSELYPTANCVSITTDSIISITARRSDANVANYFWVDSPRFNMNYDDLTRNYASYETQPGVPPYFIQNYPNVNPALYGLRKMETSTQQGSPAETNNGNGTPAGSGRYANRDAFFSWIDNRRNLLIALNEDNVMLEDGSMHLAGNERIRAGTYVKVRYGATPNNPGGDIQSLYYAHSVTHVFEPFGNYLTEVEYDRGTNFVDRITQSAGGVSPYYAEMVSWSNS